MSGNGQSARLWIEYDRVLAAMLLMVLLRKSDNACSDAARDGLIKISATVWIINFIFVGGYLPKLPGLGDESRAALAFVGNALWLIGFILIKRKQLGVPVELIFETAKSVQY